MGWRAVKRRERAPGGRAHVFMIIIIIIIISFIIKWRRFIRRHGSGQYLYYIFLTYYGMSRSGQHFICAYNNDDVCEQAFLGSGRQRILLVTEILLVGGRALQ